MLTVQQQKQNTHWYVPVPKHRVIISKSVKKTELPQKLLFSSCRATKGILLCQIFVLAGMHGIINAWGSSWALYFFFFSSQACPQWHCKKCSVWPLVCCWFLLVISISLRAPSLVYFCKFPFAVFPAPFRSSNIYRTKLLYHEIPAVDCYQENI